MKKLLVLLILGIMSTCWAEIPEPAFDEFYQPKPLRGGLFTRSAYKQEDDNYWAKRRQAFETELQTCRALSKENERITCFMQVRQLEAQKTDSYLQTQEMRQTRRDLKHKTYQCHTFGSVTRCY